MASRLTRLPELKRAWATRPELRRLDLDPTELGPDWFDLWPTWQAEYYVATAWALERAGLIVDERDDQIPRYLRAEARPTTIGFWRESRRVYGLDFNRFAAPPPPPEVLTDEEGHPIELFGRLILLDQRLGPRKVKPPTKHRGRRSRLAGILTA